MKNNNMNDITGKPKKRNPKKRNPIEEKLKR